MVWGLRLLEALYAFEVSQSIHVLRRLQHEDKKISCDEGQNTFEQKSCDLHKSLGLHVQVNGTLFGSRGV